MSFEFDYSTPHPAEMGEIYDDQLYHVMSEIRYGDNDGRPLVDISNLPPLDLSRDRIRLPEVLASWKKKIMQPITRLTEKEQKAEDSGAESGESSQRNSLKKSSSSLSFGSTFKKLAKQFSRQDKSNPAE
ncbi:hypothetical protein PENSTE_c006G01959 [Penicillium steckii]|uniref:Uncharacterized protein n=1 Tax=Penicillium steckii TaxID=303698 RepID=A0A1V6TGR7_9EURO|nr:hypothetical protein PENSTE_c006G01959 [Penicillium steckii]